MTMHVVHSLYSALARVIGRSFSRVAGSPFLYRRMVWLCNQDGDVIPVIDMAWKRSCGSSSNAGGRYRDVVMGIMDVMEANN